MSTSPQRQGKLTVPATTMTPEDYMWGSTANSPFDDDTVSEVELEYPAPQQQCKSENPPPTLTSCLVTATVQQYTFQAGDLFDIENWINAFCNHESSSRDWSWSWNERGSISDMAEWLSQKNVEVDGGVRVFVKYGTLKICIKDVLVAVAEGNRRQR